MSVIRHWIAYDTTRPKAAHIIVRDAPEATALHMAGLTVEGPFVHEDQLTGAVKALQALVEAAEGVTETRTRCPARARTYRRQDRPVVLLDAATTYQGVVEALEIIAAVNLGGTDDERAAELGRVRGVATVALATLRGQSDG